MKENYVEINFFDLCKNVLKKWKIVLIIALAFALLGGLCGVYQNNRAKPDNATRVRELTAALTQEEKENVEDAANIINSYREMYVKQKEYNANSIFQNLNPYDLRTLQLSYYVDNHYKVSYPTIEETNDLIPIITMYTSDYAKDSFYDNLAKEIGTVNPVYVKELITTNVTDKESGVFKIIIYAESDDMLEAIGDFVKNTTAEKQAEVTELYGEHDIILISETISKTVNSTMAEAQKANMERLVDITADITTEEKLFSGTQLSYLKYLVHEESDEETSVLKSSIIGLVLGLLAATLYISARYIIDGTVKTEKECSTILNVPILGNMRDVDYSLSKISTVANVNDCKKVAVLCNGSFPEKEKFESLNDFEFVFVDDVLNKKESFDSFAKCDSAVIVAETKVSKCKELISKKEMCNNANIKLLGVVLK